MLVHRSVDHGSCHRVQATCYYCVIHVQTLLCYTCTDKMYLMNLLTHHLQMHTAVYIWTSREGFGSHSIIKSVMKVNDGRCLRIGVHQEPVP